VEYPFAFGKKNSHFDLGEMPGFQTMLWPAISYGSNVPGTFITRLAATVHNTPMCEDMLSGEFAHGESLAKPWYVAGMLNPEVPKLPLSHVRTAPLYYCRLRG
jgi:hypothetical protein